MSAPITRRYDRGWMGADGVLASLLAVESGEIPEAVWTLAEHPANVAQPRTFTTVRVGRGEVDGCLTWRWCGERGPLSAGSSAVCPSWSDQGVALAAVRVAYKLGRAALRLGPEVWIYRQE